MKELVTRKNIEELKVGTKVEINSSLMPHPCARYYGEVISIHKKHVAFKVSVDQSTLNDITFGPAIPFVFSVTKADLNLLSEKRDTLVYIINNVNTNVNEEVA